MKYFHQDHLGSSTLVSDGTGIVPPGNGDLLESTDYRPFGEQRYNPGVSLTPYQYTDQEWEANTGLYNYDARLYDPVLGRFTSPDSIIPGAYTPQALNPYAYCLNNPLIYVDPSGHAWFKNSEGEWQCLADTAHELDQYHDNADRVELELAGSDPARYANQYALNQTFDMFIQGAYQWWKIGSALGFYGWNDERSLYEIVYFCEGFVSVGGAITGTGAAAQTGGTLLRRLPSRFADEAGYIVIWEGGGDAASAAAKRISVDEALDIAQDFMKDGVPIRSIDGKTGVQFIQEFSENGQRITKRVGFDLNPNSAHVKELGPHLNLQTQVNGVIQKGHLKDPHLSIDPKTVRPGDY